MKLVISSAKMNKRISDDDKEMDERCEAQDDVPPIGSANGFRNDFRKNKDEYR